jgi:hypothetical protein
MEVLLRIFPDLRRRNLFDSFPLRRPDDRARWADALSLAGLPD